MSDLTLPLDLLSYPTAYTNTTRCVYLRVSTRVLLSHVSRFTETRRGKLGSCLNYLDAHGLKSTSTPCCFLGLYGNLAPRVVITNARSL